MAGCVLTAQWSESETARKGPEVRRGQGWPLWRLRGRTHVPASSGYQRHSLAGDPRHRGHHPTSDSIITSPLSLTPHPPLLRTLVTPESTWILQARIPITDPSLNHACNIPSVTEGDTVTGDEHLGTGTLPTRCHTDTALAGQGGRAGPGRTGGVPGALGEQVQLEGEQGAGRTGEPLVLWGSRCSL